MYLRVRLNGQLKALPGDLKSVLTCLENAGFLIF